MSKEQPLYQPTGYDNSPQELVFEDSSNEQSVQSQKSEDAIDIGELGSFDDSSVESSRGSPSAVSMSDLVDGPKKKSPESETGSVFENFSPEESPVSPSALVSNSKSPVKVDSQSLLGNFDSESPQAESLGNLDSESPDLEESRSKELAVKDNSLPDGDSPPALTPKEINVEPEAEEDLDQNIKDMEKQLENLKILNKKVKEDKKKDKKARKLKRKIVIKKPKKPKITDADEEIKRIGKKCPKGYKTNKKKTKCKKKGSVVKNCGKLIDELEGFVDKLTIEENKYNKLLKCFSDKNRQSIDESYDFLYPILDDPNFNTKIAKKKEFNDTKYIERPLEDYENIENITNELCNIKEFELAPHQKFVRNFLSYKTPYDSLLIYHGLGSGKTCSSISVCEEFRMYMKQLKSTKRIIIVASPNVQENFKLQLFDERKLKNIDGNWNIKSCTGNTFIKEINPMNMRGLTRDKVIRQIKRIINNSYLFLGYIQFANWITKKMKSKLRSGLSEEEKRIRSLKQIQREFSNRLIVIDEVQNIRNTEDGSLKKTSKNLLKLVKYTDNTKLLLLSATPMFNQPQEIVWLLNLMNINDDNYSINEKDIFDVNGNLKIVDGVEVGKELLIRKSTGYVSYVRGENPFTFPFRLFPNDFNSPHSIKKIIFDDPTWYPSKQMNGNEIVEPINILDLYITRVGVYQENVYKFAIKVLKKKYPILNSKRPGIQYTVLDPLIQSLNFTYPNTISEDQWTQVTFKKMYGKSGLKNCMYNKVDERKKRSIAYKKETLTNFGRIFAPEHIGNYSGKISKICNTIKKSKGIILIYSQFIDGGCVPIALALEEMGFKRYGKNKSLLKDPTAEPIDAITMQPRTDDHKFRHASYIMITGDPILSPDNNLELNACTNENNTNGEIVKVVIVSKAGSEGLDFKNIRQVHILEPWYNINRIEQTIGRAVRNLSHCLLPFNERNVEIYLYGSELEDNTNETVDLYMYRLAENKAKKIGVISRVIKENAVDCLLNISYNKIDRDSVVELNTSTNQSINFNIRDKPQTSLCDYMENCDCNCYPDNTPITDDNVNKNTYDETFIMMNIDKILYRIKMLFKEKYVYTKDELIVHVNAIKYYPKDQIFVALTQLLEDDNEFITDMLGRLGKLVNIGDFYMFQPIEIDNKKISLFERKVPLDYKRKYLEFNLPENLPEEMEKSQIYEEEKSQKYEEEKDSKNKQKSRQALKSVKNVTKYNKLFSQIQEKIQILQSRPKLLTTKIRNSWIHNAAWTIYNLNKYNSEISRSELLQFSLHHILDILTYEEKLLLINHIFFISKPNDLELYILDYFKQFMLQDDCIILFNKNQPSPIIFLFKTENDWIEDEMKKTFDLYEKLIKRFKHIIELDADGNHITNNFDSSQSKNINSYDTGKLNELLGFMIHDTRYNIIFKSKSLNLSSSGRVQKGKSCDKGLTKNILINLINKIHDKKDGKKKYVMEIKPGSKRSSIKKIYNNEDHFLYERNESNKIINAKKFQIITTLQLCVEKELLFRYYNKIKKDDKIWFLSELESNINKIENIGI